MFEAKVILDSIAPHGKRLTTMTWRYPRFIHSEIMTHRMLSKNSASSRALPVSKLIKQVLESPVVPIRFGSEQRGMQTGGEVDDVASCEDAWLAARLGAVDTAHKLIDLGVHKSIVNRLLEPWMWITIVISGTEWDNLWKLRIHGDAEIHFQRIAGMAKEAMDQSVPIHRCIDGNDILNAWHMPFIDDSDFDSALQYVDSFKGTDTILDVLKKSSVARCARVSYLTHEGTRSVEKDLELFERLVQGSGFGHWSPHEHVAQVMPTLGSSGNFIGWKQYRKEFVNG
jgi:hypothetical protein